MTNTVESTRAKRIGEISFEDLEQHIEAAQIPTLVMLTAHITGDPKVLKNEWRPAPAVFAPNPLTAQQEAQAREYCLERLAPYLAQQRSWASRPTPELLREISTWLLGADLEDARALAEISFVPNEGDPRAPQWNLDQVDPQSTMNAVVIGSGFSGLLAALRLKQAGIPFSIIEKNFEVGGTWWENTYPDCRTDVPSHIYTYSFWQRDWETHFGRHNRIHEYLHNFAKDNGLLEHLIFGTEVTASIWDEENDSWTLQTRSTAGIEESITARVVVSAVGQLNRPSIPNIEGLESFAGPKIHSAQWDHTVDFTGKKVVVIGTGASALQFAPAVAKDAQQVTIVQRSAPWLMPMPILRQKINPDERWLMENLNQYRAFYRFSLFLPRVIGNLPSATVDPEYPPTEVAVSAANDALRLMLTKYLSDQVQDRPDLLEQIIPNYPPASKRIICDDGTWIKTLKRDNVRLVNEGVSRVDETGIWLGDEYVEADIILFGTGFKAADFLLPMKVEGIGGQDLHEKWGIDASAYLGSTLPDYPNFFCMYGPNTNTVIHGNLVFFLECQANYMIDALKQLAQSGKKSLNLREDVFAEYDKLITTESAKRTWGWSKTKSWYMNAAGRSTIMWPLPARDYFERTAKATISDYVLS
ncbi:4-hydroxyacetophenone monooxygenase [Arthrobacter sp. MYb227]|uniref:flavin-containing monooxygenase n=1 Tax=Arthrobacter sp. MYb227 TaxID=1848601 RepID=UPI000CFCAD85|nr:NAD(P)/FAD-dependent oxidoreductase [Arthrobacter sp. MYb227]PQZ94768.1 4-hydroxyacetophenone monooxygenase [Arthrobacter sp. MYb227]